MVVKAVPEEGTKAAAESEEVLMAGGRVEAATGLAVVAALLEAR